MKKITFSKNVFLPLTHVCGNACSYCSFKEPVADGCVMEPSEVKATLDRGAEFSCTEALFTFGERPELERGFNAHLQKIGYDSILDYCYDMSKYALSKGILPHSNVGIINEE
ncbi:MAG TPA: 7,8-didemethyl-8-hydroxy-5-deazariboflavin synthase subunit CofG, partial [Methanocorpusculum sp.]|nr:7,8-didemethyl-8-hydroxy-5-deazariboflavin synthase subunit CofG [Methanocorpusculum sp.]